MMNYFINERYIKSNLINHAIEQAYEPYTMQHRYPFTALQLFVEPEQIDVNVHPQKMELRFHGEKEIYDSVFQGISEALKYRELIPEVTFRTKEEELREKEEKKQYEKRTGFEPFEKNRREKEGIGTKTREKPAIREGVSEEKPFYGEKQVENTERVQNVSPERDTGYRDEMKQERQSVAEVPLRTAPVTELEGSLKEVSEKEKAGRAKEDSVESEDVAEVQQVPQNMYPVLESKQETLFEEGLLSGKIEKEIKIIGQVFSTYWILQYEDNMYLIDQHAAHEKVLFEKTMHSFRERSFHAQQINPPIILQLSVQEYERFWRCHDAFEKLGFEAEPFGDQTIAIRALPSDLYGLNGKEVFLSLIDDLREISEKDTPESVLENVAS
ncbi:MAG: hypothetical protein IJ733_13530, partial [Lachnospiraceae bacterium]|nr:hypothetical protein [Lachnospiraceae bacterium]